MSWQHPLLPDGLPMNHGAMAAAEDGSAQALDTSIPTQRLSCEQCRARKVKCDRIHPCTPCTGKQVKCTFPGGFKPRQKRQRPVVSSSYEDKIDEISSKLDQIRTAIDTIGLSSHPIANAPGTSHSNAFPRGTLTPVTSSSYRGQSPLAASNRDDLSEAESEDDTPLRTHAAHAADLVQQMVDNTCSGLTPDVTSSLDALQRIVQTKSKRKLQTVTTSPAKGAETPTIEGLKLPPLETAMMCLGMVRENETIKYLCFFELESVGDFVEYLPSCYSQKPSITDLIIVNVGLARIFYCCSFYEPDAHLRAEYESQSTACYRNIDLVMPQLPFAAAHTFDLALALCMASSHYMEIARPRMAWKLAVHSTHVCQSLGFNRGDIENSSAARRQKRLFIMCCVMEKTLAFCLGKASVIRSSDMPTVDVEMTDGFSTSLDPLWRKWIDIALVQDQVYDDLCSPRALMQPGGVRDARARYLAAELEKLFFTQDSAETRCLQAIRDSVGDTIADIFWRSMRISGLAMLTLIYRTAPPGTDAGSAFSASCISAAVQALEEHQQCMRLLENVSHSMLDFYVQWALLSAPFVPYIVVFCLTVETSSAYYLTKLASVVEATEKVASTYREVYEKQLAIFRLMYDVACKCVEARNPGSEASRQPEKLAAGTVSVPADPNMTAASSSFPFDQSFGFQSLDPTVASMGADHSAAMPGGNMAGLSLGDWMDQNYQIFQLLEEDAVMDWDTRGAPGK